MNRSTEQLTSNRRGGSTTLCLLLLLLLLLVSTWAAADPPPAAGTLRLRWFGHSCFLLESPGGKRVLIDPLPPSLGYPVPQVDADLVVVSHPHFDHSYTKMATREPTVLWGVSPESKKFQPTKHRAGDLLVRSVESAHDDVDGRERGANAIFVLTVGGIEVVHLGDLGHELSRAQVDAVGPVDVLLVPVGGTVTLGARRARAVIKQLAPRLAAIPMHYKTSSLKMKLPLAGVDPFLRGIERVRRVGSSSLVLGPATAAVAGGGMEVLVLDAP